MKWLFFQKISAWLNMHYNQMKRQGTFTLLTIFMFMVFSALGLSLITFSQIYLRLCSFKKNATLLTYASENGIKQGLEQLSGQLEQTPQPLHVSPIVQDELFLDAQNGGVSLIKKFLHDPLPLTDNGEEGKIFWESRISLSLSELKPYPTYFSATYLAKIESTGMLKPLNAHKQSCLEATLVAQAGQVPLPSLPFLLGKNLTSQQKQDFISDNDITITMPTSLLAPSLFSGEDIIPHQESMLIQQALKINIFSPQDLSPAILRQALGLEASAEPVPEGVYLIQDDLGLGGIFVQGDLDELIFAIENDFQVISFLQGQNLWILRFNPSAAKSTFQTPEEIFHFDLVPRGILICEGKILSLGGGIIDKTGSPVLKPDEEIPCILQGVNFTIISTGTITLTAHLIHQGVNWQDGVPYVKDSSSQLNIFASGNNILGEDTGSGEIVIQVETTEELKIQASITAAKNGVSIQGENQEIYIYGSVHTPEYRGGENSLHLYFDDRFLFNESLHTNAPVTQNPIVSLIGMKILVWEDY